MNKMHNNLNIENLVKTEWINQFNKKQQEEILQGLEDNLKISVYVKPDFDWEQMRQIRLGLLHYLDVSIYANPIFDWEQMF